MSKKWGTRGYLAVLGLGLLGFLACEVEQGSSEPDVPEGNALALGVDTLQEWSEVVVVLRPAEEQRYRVELWAAAEPGSYRSLAATRLYPPPEGLLPIGTYPLDWVGGQLIAQYPNAFYLDKRPNEEPVKLTFGFTGSLLPLLEQAHSRAGRARLLIVPRLLDRGAEVVFQPCRTCPHWTGELYSSLALELDLIYGRN